MPGLIALHFRAFVALQPGYLFGERVVIEAAAFPRVPPPPIVLDVLTDLFVGITMTS